MTTPTSVWRCSRALSFKSNPRVDVRNPAPRLRFRRIYVLRKIAGHEGGPEGLDLLGVMTDTQSNQSFSVIICRLALTALGFVGYTIISALLVLVMLTPGWRTRLHRLEWLPFADVLLFVVSFGYECLLPFDYTVPSYHTEWTSQAAEVRATAQFELFSSLSTNYIFVRPIKERYPAESCYLRARQRL